MMNKLIVCIAAITLIASCTTPQNENKSSSPVTQSTQTTNNGLNTRIVFVNQDSLLENYELYQESKVALEDESRKAQNSISSKLEAFQKKIQKFQQKVYETQQKAATLAPVELQRLEKQFAKEQEVLAAEEQRLVQQRDNAAIELEKRIIDLQNELTEKIDEYLAELAIEKSYDFVLIKGTGGGVLYGNAALDITEDVVKSLNERHTSKN